VARWRGGETKRETGRDGARRGGRAGWRRGGGGVAEGGVAHIPPWGTEVERLGVEAVD